MLLTANIRDFVLLHQLWLQSNHHHAGLILVKQQAHTIGEMTRGIVSIGTRFSPEELCNQILFLSNFIPG
ncbi:MAG: hypothetical protein OHK0012_12380 [Synechococcales cyanobacterium]